MKRLTKLLIPLILAQAICLGLGLWLQDRFLLSMIESQSQTEMINDAGLDAEFSIPGPGVEVTSNQATKAVTESLASVRMLGFIWIIGLQGIAAYLIIARANTEHIEQQQKRHEVSLHKSRELTQTRDAIIFGLAKLAESRDPETGQHLERITMYSTRLATALRHEPIFRERVSSMFVKMIGISSALHDIGKVGIEDSILLKPGKLTIEERRQMQTHTQIGGDCIAEIEQRLGNSTYLNMAREIAYCHHERWDGKGYGKGLKGEEIPLAARIVSIADVYDALRSKRIYKEAISHKKCVEIIKSESGKQFDPKLVKVFLKIAGQMNDISVRFSDPSDMEVDSSSEPHPPVAELVQSETKQPILEKGETNIDSLPVVLN